MIVLPAGHAWTWALQDFRGHPVVLVFYPADWEPVSTDQLRRYNEVLPEVRALGAELVGVSVDSVWCHRASAHDLGLEFRLLSDFHPRAARRARTGCTIRVNGPAGERFLWSTLRASFDGTTSHPRK
jgi:peroxiredoxin